VVITPLTVVAWRQWVRASALHGGCPGTWAFRAPCFRARWFRGRLRWGVAASRLCQRHKYLAGRFSGGVVCWTIRAA